MNLASVDVDKISHDDRGELLGLLDKIKKAENREVCQSKYIPFVKSVWPAFIEGRHHEIMGEAFEKVARGELKRLIVNMPPRHTFFLLGF